MKIGNASLKSKKTQCPKRWRSEMKKIFKAFEENGWVALSKFGYGLLDGSRNALRFAPMEYKYLLSILLAAMWCIAFGIYTVELMYIGYNIIGHWVLITAVFFTWFVFTTEKRRSPKSPPNKVKWDLEREG